MKHPVSQTEEIRQAVVWGTGLWVRKEEADKVSHGPEATGLPLALVQLGWYWISTCEGRALGPAPSLG